MMSNTLSQFRCGRFPPVVKTAVPVDGRFEHIVLSCNVTSDHAIIWIEREAQRALEVSSSGFYFVTLTPKSLAIESVIIWFRFLSDEFNLLLLSQNTCS